MIDELYTSPELKAAWNDWITYRKERKLPKYVLSGLRKTITRLEEITGKDEKKAIAYINYSIAQNYQGIFPDPLYERNQQGTTENNGQPTGTSSDRIAAVKNF